MGYLTRFTLELAGEVDYNFDYEEAIGKHSGYDSSWIFEDCVKWYEHEEEMLSFSKLHPKVIFCLSGEGEESDDQWHKYFKDGKMQTCRAKITFDPYDESKLR